MKAGLAGSVRSTIDELARKRRGALLDPDLPIDIGFTEGVMIGFNAVDGRRSDLVGGLQGLHAVLVAAVAPPEQVLQRQGDAELVVERVEHLARSSAVPARSRKIPASANRP